MPVHYERVRCRAVAAGGRGPWLVAGRRRHRCTAGSMRMMAMRVAMLAAECEPWAKTGGLGDMVDALARALGRVGRAAGAAGAAVEAAGTTLAASAGTP